MTPSYENFQPQVLAVLKHLKFATMTTYIIPFVSIIVGLFDKEKIMPIQLVGLFVILIGVYIGSRD